MKSGKDRRRYTRYKQESLTASIGGEHFRAHITDFSLGGLSFYINIKPIV